MRRHKSLKRACPPTSLFPKAAFSFFCNFTNHISFLDVDPWQFYTSKDLEIQIIYPIKYINYDERQWKRKSGVVVYVVRIFNMETIKDTEKTFHYGHWRATPTVLISLLFAIDAGFAALVWINFVRGVRSTATVSNCCQNSIPFFFSPFILILTGNKTAQQEHKFMFHCPIYFRAEANNRIFPTALPLAYSLIPRMRNHRYRQHLSVFKASIYRRNTSTYMTAHHKNFQRTTVQS